jgi:hypothetical protein
MIFNGLNDAIKAQAKRMNLPQFTVSDFAPQTFEDLVKHYKATGSLVIWSGGSDHTIYQDPKINYLFRAMHDITHIQLNADFTMDGEKRVAIYQMSQVGTELAKIIDIEVIKQAEYYMQTGSFLDDQVKFTIQQLKAMR